MHEKAYYTYLEFQKKYSSHTISAYVNDIEQFIFYLKSTFDIEDVLQVTHVHVRSWIVHLMQGNICLLYTSPSPRDGLLSRMPSSA